MRCSTDIYEVLYGVRRTPSGSSWQVGDLAVWDNLALQHHRPDFPATEGRTMQRVCIHSKTAEELVPNLPDLLV